MLHKDDSEQKSAAKQTKFQRFNGILAAIFEEKTFANEFFAGISQN